MATRKSTSTSRARATRTNASRVGANSIKNNRNQHFIILVVLLAVALIGAIGVAVAAFAQDLKINGTATVKGTSWDIHFDNLKSAQIVSSLNTAKENTAPTIDSTNTIIKDYDVVLKSDADAISYVFDVVNAGDIDAEITGVVMNTGSTLTCTSTGGTAAEQTTRNTNTCANLSYTLTYADGAPVNVGDPLPANSSKMLKLTLEYKAKGSNGTGTEYYPDDDVKVKDLGVTITYGQDN